MTATDANTQVISPLATPPAEIPGHNLLLGKKVVVTAAAGTGIGFASARRALLEGADVLVSDWHERRLGEAAEKLAAEFPERTVTQRTCNVQETAEVDALIADAATQLGRIDVLVNNAAYQMSRDGILEIPDGEWEHTFQTNIFAMYYLSRAAWPHLAPGSTIINTASIQAYQPSPQLLPYAATKAAIVNFSKALAQEGAEKGIRVNAVAPGPIWTPLIPATMPEEKAQQFGKDSPMGRPGQPAELAPLYVFLASTDSSYITGEVIGVTGGQPLA